MGREQFRQHGNEAASFAKDLQAEREALTPALSAAEEVAALERARWLVEREFDATVTVEAADDAPDLADDAEPGRPAIRID
jgi:leucyl-tRNA synthetase